MCQHALHGNVPAICVYEVSVFFFRFEFFLNEVLYLPTQGGLATAFDLAAFRLSMIAPVKKSVNHSTTVASMRETG